MTHWCTVMMIGIIIQLVGVVIFALVATDCIWRIYVDRPVRGKSPNESTATLQARPGGSVRISKPMGFLFIGIGISTSLVVIRFVLLFDTLITMLT